MQAGGSVNNPLTQKRKKNEKSLPRGEYALARMGMGNMDGIVSFCVWD